MWYIHCVKLLFCQQCFDIILLQSEPRKCACQKSSGRYLDGINAELSGPCIPLGISNSSFLRALQNRPREGMGERFEAFIIPRQCESVRSKV